MGFLDTATEAAPTIGAWLDMVGNGTGWVITGKTVNSGATSSTGTTYTCALSTWYSARLVVNSAATLVTFSVSNEAGTVLWTDTLATAIPVSATGTGFGIVGTDSSADAATVLLSLDYLRLEIVRDLIR